MVLRIALCLLLLPTAGFLPVSAQQGDDVSDAFRSWPSAGVAWKATSVAGEARSLTGGWFGFGITPRTLVGGAGFRLNGTIPLRPFDESGLRLHFGYAGLAAERRWSVDDDWAVAAGGLVGAGHATVTDRRLGIERDADNFAVTELEILLVWRRVPHLELAAGAGYRFVAGVDDLTDTTAGDLRGSSLSLAVRLTGG